MQEILPLQRTIGRRISSCSDGGCDSKGEDKGEGLVGVGKEASSNVSQARVALSYSDDGASIKLVMMGFEVDKPSKIMIKTLYTKIYIISDIQNTETRRTYDPIN